jgi:predicted dehydrogenase
MKLGLVGYGVGGRYYHAPFIEAVDGLELAGVVTRDPSRRAQLAIDFPDVPHFDSLSALLETGVDVVTITTPPSTRRALVLKAIGAGVAVVADKPFAPTAAAAQDLVDAADRANVPLSVYQNRRWDADLQTLASLIRSGELGTPSYFESRMDQDGANTLEAGPDGGLLRDLGSHVVDQALWLFGPVATVLASMVTSVLPQGPTDSAFRIDLLHTNGVRTRLSATKLNHINDRELRLYGTNGVYVSHTTDVQARAVIAGDRPKHLGDLWGFEPESHWGTLFGPAGHRRVPSQAGRYQEYYLQLAAALRGEGPLPVTGQEAVRTLEVIDAARHSSESGKIVALSP